MNTFVDIYSRQDVMAQKLNIPEIVRKYGNSLKGFIRKRVNNVQDAEDITQEVFYQLSEMDRPIDQMAAWLFTVARNKITDLYRKKKTVSLPSLSDDNEYEEMVAEISELFYDSGNTPENDYLRSLIWEELEKALGELPKEQRQVFEMNELQGVPFNEIAAETGETVSTLISRKHYAVLHLRQRLRVLYNELINF